MSKSMTHCRKYYEQYAPGTFNFDIAKERTAEKYFDRIMQGKRERIRPFKDGFIKVRIDFDRNGEYNYVGCWSGTRTGFKDDIEDNIMHSIEEELLHNAIVPFENNEPIGGWPQPGDLILVTYGNIIIINDIKMVDGEITQKLSIMIPKFYKRIPGGYHE